MRELRPGLRGSRCADVRFDDVRHVRIGESDQPRQPPHMGVDRESGLAQSVPEHHVRGLATHAGEPEQAFHRAGEFAVELLDDGLRRRDDVRGFRVVEPAGEDGLFEFVLRTRRERRRVRPPPEEVARDHVHAFVRALGRQNRRDEQLKRRHVLQKAFLGAVDGQQFVVDLFCQRGFHGVKGEGAARCARAARWG